MASFDFESGMRGAQAGSSTGNPYVIAAGFVIGGFFGGSKKEKAKAKSRRENKLYRQKMQRLTSPEYYGQVVQKMLPSMREAVASGLGPQEQSAIATSLARGGYTGTGIGEVGRAVGVAMPQIEAFRQASSQATPAINREIEGFLANARSKQIDVGYGGGAPPSDPFGSAGGLVNALGAMGSMKGGGGYGGGNIASMFSPSMSAGPSSSTPQWENGSTSGPNYAYSGFNPYVAQPSFSQYQNSLYPSLGLQ